MSRVFLSLYATRRGADPIGERYEADDHRAACERAEELELDGWYVTLSRVNVTEHVTRLNFRQAMSDYRGMEAQP